MKENAVYGLWDMESDQINRNYPHNFQKLNVQKIQAIHSAPLISSSRTLHLCAQ